MSTPLPSDDAILQVNSALTDALTAYLSGGVTITFELPDMDNVPAEPTLSVFLYEIHEDLQMRTGQVLTITPDPQTGLSKISPGSVNVSCNYLITYWPSSQAPTGVDSPAAEPSNECITIMNQVVNALINNRQLGDIPGAYTRMIPPKDELNSLGNFWQSLGNKPRLSLHAAVTVPVVLTDKNVTAPTVVAAEADVEPLSPLA